MKSESTAILSPVSLKQYHVFLASPGDVNEERQTVRQFFERYNRYAAQLWSVRFEIVDWENYATIGVGRPQELITEGTLERYKDSLALVVGVMAQRFGSPTGKAESGTEEEFRWALKSQRTRGFPEIKWFFRRVDKFISPPSPDAIIEAAEQWKRVREFRSELKKLDVFFAEYPDPSGFREVLENDLTRWLMDPSRPWAVVGKSDVQQAPSFTVPQAYYETVDRQFRRLDIAGIDNDRAFEIPLSEIYVRLRVMFDEDAEHEIEIAGAGGDVDIQTALLHYSKLAIVGDPGSGKSTFLKYIALMLARSVLTENPTIALEKLCLQEPLPIPVFVSCWDLSDFLKKRGTAELSTLLSFLEERLRAWSFQLSGKDLETLLSTGSCCLMFDGLDEVPTDSGRAMVSRLLEDCVKRYPSNRYVVTSRVRAYSGDAILKGEFTRCDVQPFDANDRAQFLSNWIGLLFKVIPERVLTEGSEANREFQSLTTGIERNDRIRPLAVNPLLLTVIAIVHWNRKRLPEQRVELYDECVDVLLGQRKEAEHVQIGRKVETLDVQLEEQQHEERSWVRKRFAEIALHIQNGEGNQDEATRSDLVKILAPRFVDQGASTQEQAESRATLFLDRQEVRSGLLVSRREQSYRFVHLTFQEYLTAWHLSNQEFDDVVAVILSRIRQQRWFESLQLLGSEWGKKSDEKLDRYISWLLQQQGTTIVERAPIIALCANIIKDTSGIAELRPDTRVSFQQGVEGTLDAFRPRSRIPALTQLEILEALGTIGAAVKSHIIDATKSGLFQVRRRAIEMLLPHLSDDELFDMVHILEDRSREPVSTYLLMLLNRNAERTNEWFYQRLSFGDKALEGFVRVIEVFKARLNREEFRGIVRHVFTCSGGWGWWGGGDYYWPFRAQLVSHFDDSDFLRTALEDKQSGVRARAMMELVRTEATLASTWNMVRQAASKDENFNVRIKALGMLAAGQKSNDSTWHLVREAALKDNEMRVRSKALELLVSGENDINATWLIVRHAAVKDENSGVRVKALELLALGQKDASETWQLVCDSVVKDPDSHVQLQALQLLARGQQEVPHTWDFMRHLIANSTADPVRNKALELLVSAQRDVPETWAFVRKNVKSIQVKADTFFVIAKALYTDTITLKLLSRDLDGARPGIVPNQLISRERVKSVSSQLSISEKDVREWYERIAESLMDKSGISLQFEWKGKSTRLPK